MCEKRILHVFVPSDLDLDLKFAALVTCTCPCPGARFSPLNPKFLWLFYFGSTWRMGGETGCNA